MSQSVRVKGRRAKMIEEVPKGKKKTTKKTNEKEKVKEEKEAAMKNEALDFYRQLIERGFKPFDGASIDFHRKRDPVVFIPRENPVLTAVRREELMDFLKANNVNRVLVDALFPSRVPILQSLLEHGIEVYVLRRPTALAGFKAMLERRYNKKKKDGNNNDNNNGIKIPRKNDFVDAVALAFTWPKFHRKVDIPYLICWRAMNRWRHSYMLYYKVQQMLSEDEDESPVVTLHEDRLIKKAKMFVDTVEMHYPKIRQVFEEVRIPEDDVIAQALCSEIALETYHLKKFSRVLRKAGIGIQSVPKKKVRKKKEEVEKTEDKQTENRPKRKVFQYDGKLLFAANQLTIRLYHINPKKEPEKVMLKTKKLLEEIWKRSRKLQMTEENGRVGEALEGVRPLSNREGYAKFETRPHGLGPCLPCIRREGKSFDKRRHLPRSYTPGRTDNTTAMS
jgi:uncharacterized protein YoxC